MSGNISTTGGFRANHTKKWYAEKFQQMKLDFGDE